MTTRSFNRRCRLRLRVMHIWRMLAGRKRRKGRKKMLGFRLLNLHIS
jgi:hypothetical protein